MAALAILGLILVGVMQYSRTRRLPVKAIDKTSPLPPTEPKPRDVARRPLAKSDKPPNAPKPDAAKRTKEETKKPTKPAGSAGFRPIFNSRDLAGWDGMLEDYEVRDGVIRSHSPRRTVIFFARTFTDFVGASSSGSRPAATAGW